MEADTKYILNVRTVGHPIYETEAYAFRTFTALARFLHEALFVPYRIVWYHHRSVGNRILTFDGERIEWWERNSGE